MLFSTWMHLVKGQLEFLNFVKKGSDDFIAY